MKGGSVSKKMSESNMTEKKIIIMLQVAIVSLFVLPGSAYAYLDPGTGSMIFQVLAAGLVSVLAFYSKIKTGLKNFFTKNKDEEDI
ncbi:hypothetical protein [Desulfovibrio sp. JC010]|uniref:hypothetical protein n=1 Tax=Desulfovibrio sp. JC010 TaxID=2593641 RepID=UPI0013D59E5A|nr:hypothetical protein [Desulfovibrio sp. JC010]NDV26326.1 hypothetical protein [Desulfovibrio sp. JC010]